MRLAAYAASPTRPAVGMLGVVAVPLIAGIAVVEEPAIAAPLVMLIGVTTWFVLRAALAWWDVLVLVMGGAYLLDYGFANVGIAGPLPLPLVDLLVAALIVRVATRRRFEWPTSLPFLLAGAFVALTCIRLTVDIPKYGVFAVRDATLGIELLFLVVGYWAMLEYGIHRFVRSLSIIFVIAIVYTAFYPMREAIAEASPMVGLQRPVPLFGTYSGGLVIGAIFFFFALVRPFGVRSYLLAAASLPLVLLVQIRGLYVAIPLVIVLIWVLARARLGAQLRRGIASTIAIGVVVLAIFFPFAPKGRLGEVTPSFIVAQLATLSGREGPSAGTVDVRKEWFARVTDEVASSSTTLLLGLGLGPDLAFGADDDGQLVRKPHNDYLEVYARYGVLGIVIFLSMILVAFARIVRGAQSAHGLEGRFLWFAVAQTALIAVLAATQPFLAFPYGTVPLFTILGAALAVTGTVTTDAATRRSRGRTRPAPS